jgi:hypothetical protein
MGDRRRRRKRKRRRRRRRRRRRSGKRRRRMRGGGEGGGEEGGERGGQDEGKKEEEARRKEKYYPKFSNFTLPPSSLCQRPHPPFLCIVRLSAPVKVCCIMLLMCERNVFKCSTYCCIA